MVKERRAQKHSERGARPDSTGEKGKEKGNLHPTLRDWKDHRP